MESLLEGDGQLAFEKFATATIETLMPRIEGKGKFGKARREAGVHPTDFNFLVYFLLILQLIR